MDTDLAVVIGLVILALAIPSMIAAFVDSRAPRLGALLFVIGGGLVAWAVMNHPGGYDLREVPDSFIRVVARLVN